MDNQKSIMVSIIMPVYKAKDTISRALESIVNQTYIDWELIVVIEKDTDDETYSIIKTYSNKDNRLKCVRKMGNKGVAASLNLGIDISRGKYIARMDADDYSHQERIKKQVQYMEKNPDVAILGTLVNVCSGRGIEQCYLPVDYEHIKATMLFWDCLVHPSVMFRGDIVRKERWKYDERCIAEDYELWLRIIKTFKIENMDEVLLDYYYDGVSNTSSDFSERRDAVWQVLNSSYSRFYNKSIIIPKQLIGYECGKEYWYDNLKVLTEVLIFLEELLKINSVNNYCEQVILEEVIVERWNRFLMDNYGFHLLNSQYKSLLISNLVKHSIYESIALALGTCKNRISFEIDSLLKDCCKDLEKIEKIIIYGAGENYRRYAVYCKTCEIVALVDENKCGTIVDGVLVESPLIISENNYDAIVVSTQKNYAEILQSLVDNGVDRRKVYPIELFKLKDG